MPEYTFNVSVVDENVVGITLSDNAANVIEVSQTTNDISVTINAVIEIDKLHAVNTYPCDGVTTDFTLTYTPKFNSTIVSYNGVVQEPGEGKDYTISGKVVSMSFAPEDGSRLVVFYVKE